MENLVLDVVTKNGEQLQIEVVMAFDSEKTQKQYVVYTKNEMDQNDKVILYASAMVTRDVNIILEDITDEEWLMVKDQMRDVVRTGKEGEA